MLIDGYNSSYLPVPAHIVRILTAKATYALVCSMEPADAEPTEADMPDAVLITVLKRALNDYRVVSITAA